MIGLTPNQANLLAFIERCPKPPTFRQMGKALGYSESNLTACVSALLDQLQEKGRVRRQYNRPRSVEIIEPLRPVIINGQRYRFIPLERAEG